MASHGGANQCKLDDGDFARLGIETAQREKQRRSNLRGPAIRSSMVRWVKRDLERDTLQPIRRCLIRVYYDVGKAIETREHAGDSKEP